MRGRNGRAEDALRCILCEVACGYGIKRRSENGEVEFLVGGEEVEGVERSGGI